MRFDLLLKNNGVKAILFFGLQLNLSQTWHHQYDATKQNNCELSFTAFKTIIFKY
jgi:hypothetical protein